MSRKHLHLASLTASLIILIILIWVTANRPPDSANLPLAALFSILIVFATTFGVPIGGGWASLLPMTTVAAYLVMGLAPAAWAAIVGALAHSWVRYRFADLLGMKRRSSRLERTSLAATNAPIQSASILSGGAVFQVLGGVIPLTGAGQTDGSPVETPRRIDLDAEVRQRCGVDVHDVGRRVQAPPDRAGAAHEQGHVAVQRLITAVGAVDRSAVVGAHDDQPVLARKVGPAVHGVEQVTDLAVDLLQQCADLYDDSAGVQRTLGAAYYRTGDYRSSQVALQQALSLDKSSPLSYFLMGCTLVKLGRSEAAAMHFRQAGMLDPRYAVRR